MKYREYIDREIVKETEKAYLVKVEVNNRRDGQHTNFKWVAKSKCKKAHRYEDAEYLKNVDSLPQEIKAILPKYVAVPEWLIGEGRW